MFCKACNSAYSRKWQQENAEYLSAWRKRYHREHPEISREASRLVRQRHPLRIKARNAINNAVYQGRIQKPTSCEECKRETERTRLHAHHEDYEKPLEVQWLCRSCHTKHHHPA